MGLLVGLATGFTIGLLTGMTIGLEDKVRDGSRVGFTESVIGLGLFVGENIGFSVGLFTGSDERIILGDIVLCVGSAVTDGFADFL